MNSIAKKVKKYKELKADIVDIDIRMKELEQDILGVSEQPQGERVGKTYKITSSVEKQAERHAEKQEELIRVKLSKTRQIERIENALSILGEVEKDIIEIVLINNYRYSKIEEKLHLSYSRIKQVEAVALKKMEKYL